MNRFLAVVVLNIAFAVTATIGLAGGKTYQFTGTVLEVRDNAIVIEKGTGKDKEKFEMAKDAGTKIKGDLKVGAKVTVQYESRAAEIEVKTK